MLCQNFRGLKNAIHIGTGANHTLVFLEKIRQHAGICHRDRRPAIGDREGYGLALPAHQRAFLDQPANAEHLGRAGRLLGDLTG